MVLSPCLFKKAITFQRHMHVNSGGNDWTVNMLWLLLTRGFCCCAIATLQGHLPISQPTSQTHLSSVILHLNCKLLKATTSRASEKHVVLGCHGLTNQKSIYCSLDLQPVTLILFYLWEEQLHYHQQPSVQTQAHGTRYDQPGSSDAGKHHQTMLYLEEFALMLLY